MALLGFIAGFLLDEAIARLAREPFERGEIEEEDLRLKADGGLSIELSSETGALDMPKALTTGSVSRRLVVLAATTALFAAAGWRYDGEPLSMLIVAVYISALIICTGTDVLAYRVPNVITYPAILGAILIGSLAPDADRADVWLGGIITGGVFLAMSIVTRGGMGLGDVKLAFFTGFALGLTFAIPALLITAIAGGIIAVLLMVTRVRGRKDPIPYAPFIAMGALYVFLARGTAFIEL
jgi:prepilin signal peptidase PulO-like enzyme (type II secretory pathway)